MDVATGYELVDFGGGARLERFGARLVVRPHPAAVGPARDPGAWSAADLRYDRGTGWASTSAHEPWEFEFEDLRLELRPTPAGQVGLFPEHARMLSWLRERIVDRPATSVLHLFAYTGLITLCLAAAGAMVTHVDASRPTVAWARRNAGLSGLADRPIRWIVDDALEFTRREVRRGRRFGGVVLDPPSYGHGAAGHDWRTSRDLEALLIESRALLDPDGFVLLTSHTPEVSPTRLTALLGATYATPPHTIGSGVLGLRSRDGRSLDLGSFARWPARAS